MEIKENSILKNVKVKNLPIILQWGPKAGKENIYGKKMAEQSNYNLSITMLV